MSKQDEARIFHLAAGQMLPLLEDMHTSAYEKLMQKFESGQEFLIAEVAVCKAYYDLIQEIELKATNYEIALEGER